MTDEMFYEQLKTLFQISNFNVKSIPQEGWVEVSFQLHHGETHMWLAMFSCLPAPSCPRYTHCDYDEDGRPILKLVT